MLNGAAHDYCFAGKLNFETTPVSTQLIVLNIQQRMLPIPPALSPKSKSYSRPVLRHILRNEPYW